MTMHAVSAAQFEAATRGGVPDPERIAEGLWSVAVPMPGDLLAYTLSVVHVGPDGAVTIVDPGWETPGVHERLASALTGLGRSVADLRWIVVTHAHPDHLGAAAALRRASGAALLMHEREQAGIDRARDRALLPEPADVRLRDGDELPIPGFRCTVLATPGHTAGHICLVDRERRLLFSGDHVLPTLFPGVGLGIGADASDSDPVAAFLASLERLAPYDDYEVVPGHGYRFRGLAARRADARAHLLGRAREVEAALAADPQASVWTIASQLTWSAGWERLSRGPMLSSALLQTGYYADFVRSGGLGRV